MIPSKGASLIPAGDDYDVNKVFSWGVDVVGGKGEYWLEIEWVRVFNEDYRVCLENHNIEFVQVLNAIDIPEEEFALMLESGRYQRPVYREKWRDTSLDPTEFDDRVKKTNRARSA